MKLVTFSALVLAAYSLLFASTASATTTYSCDGCTNSQYETLAKQSTGEVFVYDLVKSTLKRYQVTVVTLAKDSPTGMDIKQIIPLTPDSKDVEFINTVASLRKNATYTSGNTIVYHADYSLKGSSVFGDKSIYDIADAPYLQNQIAEELMYGNVEGRYLKDAIEVINDVGASIIKVILKHDLVVVFRVELGDGGLAVFEISINDPNGLPNFDVTNSFDADKNAVIASNHASAAANYHFSTERNLDEFIAHLQLLGIPVQGPIKTGTWGCVATTSGVVCTLRK